MSDDLRLPEPVELPDAGGGPETVAQLLGRCLLGIGATRAFGAAEGEITGLPGLRHVRVEDPALASVLADAAGRLGAGDGGDGPGVALLPGRRLRLSSAPGVDVVPIVVRDATELPELVATWSLDGAGVPAVHAAVELELQVDLDAPAPAGAEPLRVDLRSGARAMALGPDVRDVGFVVLAGPGVVRAGAVEALRTLARRGGAGVLNTWGAKGVFRWDDPHHLGTIGLQADDVALSGLAEAPLVVATGIDPDELPGLFELPGQVLEVAPWELEPLTWSWPEPDPPPPSSRPALYRRLAEALAGPYEADAVPLHPARAARDLGAAAPRGALVAADPGPAGLWVARALPTTEVGSVVVPATGGRGTGTALAVAAALDGRDAFAITTDPVDPASAALLELAEVLGLPVVQVVWGADAELAAAADHLAALRAARRSGEATAVGVPVDLAATRELVEVAGPVVAWMT